MPEVLASHLSRLDGDEKQDLVLMDKKAPGKENNNFRLDMSCIHRTSSAVERSLDYSPMKEQQKTMTEKLTPCKIPRPVYRRPRSTSRYPSDEGKISAASHQSIANIQELHSNLAELVTLMSTAKFQNFKELFSQLNNLVTDNKSLLGTKPPDDSGTASLSSECKDSDFSNSSDVKSEEDIIVTAPIIEDRNDDHFVDGQVSDHSDGEDDNDNSTLQSNTIQPIVSSASSVSSLTSSVGTTAPIAVSSGEPFLQSQSPEDAVQSSCDQGEREHDLAVERTSLTSVDQLQQEQVTVAFNELQQQEVVQKGRRRRSVRESISNKAHKQSKAASSKPTLKYLWKAYVDGSSGDAYYHNKRDNVTTWEKPSDEEMRLVLLADGSVTSDATFIT